MNFVHENNNATTTDVSLYCIILYNVSPPFRSCISPRFDIKANEMEQWVGRLLPSRQFGVIILTTSAGIMDMEEARRKNIGGKILGTLCGGQKCI